LLVLPLARLMTLATNSLSVFQRDVLLYATKIITSVIVARRLGPEILGVSVILGLIPSYAESFGRFKFDVAAVYFLGRNKYGMGDVVLTLNILALITSSLVVFAVVWQFDWLYGVLFSRTEYDATWLVYFILLQVPLQFLWMNYSYLLLHKEDIATYNRMIIINALVSSVGAAALILLFDLGLWAILGAAVLGTALSLAYGVLRLGSVQRPAKLLNLPLIRDLFQYGSKLYVGGLIGHFQAYVTNLIVAVLLVPAQVAFFSMARGFGQLLDRVPAALNTVLFPRLTKTADPEEAAHLSARASRLILVLLLTVGVASATLVYPAVRIMYGTEFVPLVGPFLILIPGIVLAGAASPFMQFFLSIDRADLGITLVIPPLGLQVVLALLLIPRLGPEGAAVAFSSGLAMSAVLYAWMFLRLSSCTLGGDLASRREDLRYLKHFAAREAGRLVEALRVRVSHN
jgi:O-antigen/teichoic acid export membrane protein